MAGCASQIPDGIYENQSPDSTMRLYIGHREQGQTLPCVLGTQNPVDGMCGLCQINALAQDRYRLQFLSNDGQPIDKEGFVDLRYEPQNRAVTLTFKRLANMGEKANEIRLTILPGTEDPAVNPPWPKLRSDDAIDAMSQDIPAQPIPASPTNLEPLPPPARE